MTTATAQPKAGLRSIIEAGPLEGLPDACTIPGCKRPTMRAAKQGVASFHCKYHVQHLARHGSHWASSITAADLRPYLRTALAWIKDHREDAPEVRVALDALDALMATAGPVERPQDLRYRSARFKADVAFARLREKGIRPERLLAAHVAVVAIIDEDLGSHRVREYRIVQAAKAVHRLASGLHRRWEVPRADGSLMPVEMHTYPRSSGQVLRHIGERLEAICGGISDGNLEAILQAKRERFGLHPSHLPGWLPAWRKALMAKTRAAAAA